MANQWGIKGRDPGWTDLLTAGQGAQVSRVGREDFGQTWRLLRPQRGGGLTTLTAGFLLKLGQAVQRQSPRMRLVEKRAQRSFWSLVKERERALVRYKPSLAGPASPPPPGTIQCPVSTFPGDRSEAFQLGPSTLTVTEPNESSRPHAVEWVCWPQGRGEGKGSVQCRRGVQAAGA